MQGTLGCDCTISLLKLLPGAHDTCAAATVAHALLLPLNTLDLEQVPPGAYAICISCAMCTPQPAGFRLSHALPPGTCNAEADMSATLDQAAAEAFRQSRAARVADPAAGAQQTTCAAHPLQHDIQLSTLPPMTPHALTSSSGGGGVDSSSVGRGGSSGANTDSAATAFSYSAWLLRMLALAMSVALMLAPRGTVQRISAVRQQQHVHSKIHMLRVAFHVILPCFQRSSKISARCKTHLP